MGTSDDSSVVMDNEEESSKDYRIGGYHPVQLNELFGNRYIVVQKLGWGHFSTVWLCKDTKFGTFVAMKVQKSAQNYTEAAYDEVDLLLKIAGSYKDPVWAESLTSHLKGLPHEERVKKEGNLAEFTFVVQFLNTFTHTGINGTHVCMVFEILGVNLLEIIKRFNYQGIPIQMVRNITHQVLIGLDYLHRICGIIHTDLKPENVLVQLTQAQVKDILTRGMLLNQDQISRLPKDEPLSVLCKNVAGNEEDEKKKKKAEKRKRYRQRKKEEMKKKKQETSEIQKSTSTQDSVTEKPKKRKRKHKKKDTESEAVGDEEICDFQEADLLKSLQSSHFDLGDEVNIKIADLGNACWVHHHFATEIQTRQYRSPEVILGITYNQTADIWSLACMLFELLTGDFLFEPKSGSDFDKNQDHLAQMMETIGLMPKTWALSGSQAKQFLNKHGRLRSINHLKIWLLKDVLIEKYRFKPSEAEFLSDFMLPMLVFQPEKRASALDCLKHQWLKTTNSDIKMTDEDYEAYIRNIEEKRNENILKYERGEYVSSPEIPGGLSHESADEEDNSSFDDNDWSEEEGEVTKGISEEEYHLKMLKAKSKLEVEYLV